MNVKTTDKILILIIVVFGVVAGKVLLWNRYFPAENQTFQESSAEGSKTPGPSPVDISNPGSSASEPMKQRNLKPEDKTANPSNAIAWEKLKGPVTKTPGCGLDKKAQTTIRVTPDETFQFYRNHKSYSKAILLDPFRFCLQTGTEVQIEDVQPRGKFKIVGMELLQINQRTLAPISKSKIAKDLPISAWGPLVFDFFTSYDFSPFFADYRLAVLVVFEITQTQEIIWDVAGSLKPPLVSGIKYFKKEQFQSPDPQIVLIDVRSEPEFKAGHLPGAINLPYLFKVSEKSGPRPSPLNIQNGAWKYSGLPLDKSKPIVIYGQDIYDPRPWAAYLSLNMLKHSNLGWYLDGYSDFARDPVKILSPAKYSIGKDKIFDSFRFFETLRSQPTLVYVGAKELAKNRFTSFLKVPYFSQKLDFPLQTKSALELKSQGDLFDTSELVNKKNELIILLDDDETSPRPLKAFHWLTSEGFKNVVVFPGGIRHLQELSRARPEKTNCLIFTSIKQCY